MDKQYVSEKEYDVDNEPVFPVCGNDGTCVYREYIPLSDYMKQMEAKE